MHVGDRRTTTRTAAAANSILSLGSGLAGAVPRAVGVALGIMFAPLRLFAGLSLSGASQGNRRPSETMIDVQPFRIRTISMDVVECVLRGENRGGDVALGDNVRVHGRRAMRGGRLVNVTRVENLDTGTVIRGHVPISVKYALPLALIQLAAGCFILLILLAMCGIIR